MAHVCVCVWKGFEHHINNEHHIWAYIFFFIHLYDTKQCDYTSLELFVHKLVSPFSPYLLTYLLTYVVLLAAGLRTVGQLCRCFFYFENLEFYEYICPYKGTGPLHDSYKIYRVYAKFK